MHKNFQFPFAFFVLEFDFFFSVCIPFSKTMAIFLLLLLYKWLLGSFCISMDTITKKILLPLLFYWYYIHNKILLCSVPFTFSILWWWILIGCPIKKNLISNVGISESSNGGIWNWDFSTGTPCILSKVPHYWCISNQFVF